jgi:lysophospholipase L1-like esterase
MLKAAPSTTAVEGIIDYSFKLYIPKNELVPDREDGLKYNDYANGTGEGNLGFVSYNGSGNRNLLYMMVTPNTNADTFMIRAYYTMGGTNKRYDLAKNAWHTIRTVTNTKNKTITYYVDGLAAETYAYRDPDVKTPADYGYDFGYGAMFINRTCAFPLLAYVDGVEINSTPASELALADRDALTIAGDLENVTTGLVLPASGTVYGSAITWSSDSPAVDIDGAVHLSTVDQDVTLTATIAFGSASVTKTFDLTVKATADPDRAAVDRVYNSLTLDKLTSDEAEHILSDLDLSYTEAGASVVWNSTDETAIAVNGTAGTVTRGNVDKPVTLTANITSGEASAVKAFNLRVRADGGLLLRENFNYAANSAIAGVNSWTVDNVSGSAKSTFTVKNSPDGSDNTVLHIYKPNEDETANNFVRRNISGGLDTVTASFRLRADASAQYSVNIVENALVENINTGVKSTKTGVAAAELTIDFPANKVWAPTYSTTAHAEGNATLFNGLPALETWFEFKVVLDVHSQTYNIYIDDVKKTANPVTFRYANNPAAYFDNNTNKYAAALSISQIMLKAYRQAPVGSLYVDDVYVLNKANPLVTGDYLIDQLLFQNASGGNIYNISDGGILKSIVLSKYNQDAPAAGLIAAVYDGGRLYGVKSVGVSAGGVYDVDLDLPADTAYTSVKCFVWDGLSQKLKPAAPEYSFPVNSAATIYTVGDSMMKTYSTNEPYSQTGVGQILGAAFDSGYIKVDNSQSEGGKSTKTFIEEGRFNYILANLKKGDYVFIMIGHNDLGGSNLDGRTDPAEGGAYQQYLTRYVNGARAKGAIPVLITPICVRRFTNGVFNNDLINYANSMKSLAARLNVPLADLNSKTAAAVAEMGDDVSKDYYVTRENPADNTHLNAAGALWARGFLIGELLRLDLPLTAGLL